MGLDTKQKLKDVMSLPILLNLLQQRKVKKGMWKLTAGNPMGYPFPVELVETIIAIPTLPVVGKQ
jgi:hypothetical protein